MGVHHRLVKNYMFVQSICLYACLHLYTQSYTYAVHVRKRMGGTPDASDDAAVGTIKDGVGVVEVTDVKAEGDAMHGDEHGLVEVASDPADVPAK